jgi:hypothetical protein
MDFIKRPRYSHKLKNGSKIVTKKNKRIWSNREQTRVAKKDIDDFFITTTTTATLKLRKGSTVKKPKTLLRPKISQGKKYKEKMIKKKLLTKNGKIKINNFRDYCYNLCEADTKKRGKLDKYDLNKRTRSVELSLMNNGHPQKSKKLKAKRISKFERKSMGEIGITTTTKNQQKVNTRPNTSKGSSRKNRRINSRAIEVLRRARMRKRLKDSKGEEMEKRRKSNVWNRRMLVSRGKNWLVTRENYFGRGNKVTPNVYSFSLSRTMMNQAQPERPTGLATHSVDYLKEEEDMDVERVHPKLRRLFGESLGEGPTFSTLGSLKTEDVEYGGQYRAKRIKIGNCWRKPRKKKRLQSSKPCETFRSWKGDSHHEASMMIENY